MQIWQKLFATVVGLGVLSGLIAMAPLSLWSDKGMVAADHPLASQVGAKILLRGGNAVDATIATVLAAGIAQPAGSGLGGGGFALVQRASDPAFVLDFRERAPLLAQQEMFVQSSREKASRLGGLAVAIPNEANGLLELHQRYGHLSLKQTVQPAVQLAKEGFLIGGHLLKGMEKLESLDVQKALSQSLWNLSDVPNQHSHLSNQRLADTIQSWAKSQGSVFQTGWVAQDIVDAVQADGGILSMEDMAQVAPKIREPLTGKYRGWTVMTMPPPSSGGLVLLQVLAVLEGYDIANMGQNSSELLHLYAESFQHAYADRANFMGDPDRIEVPVQRLLDEKRITEIRQQFQSQSTQGADFYGTAIDIGQDAGTEHIAVVDANGLSVSLTTTINTEFASRLVAPKSGILLNNEMDDFVAEPGKPNYYGLIGSYANSVAPMAVPLSSMTPTILLSPDGSKRIVIGASGGPLIISSTLQVIVNLIDFEMEPSQAVSRGRIHHQWQPQKLFIDDEIPLDVRENLMKKGHILADMPLHASVQVIVCEEQTCLAASDPRKSGEPASPISIK